MSGASSAKCFLCAQCQRADYSPNRADAAAHLKLVCNCSEKMASIKNPKQYRFIIALWEGFGVKSSYELSNRFNCARVQKEVDILLAIERRHQTYAICPVGRFNRKTRS